MFFFVCVRVCVGGFFFLWWGTGEGVEIGGDKGDLPEKDSALNLHNLPQSNQWFLLQCKVFL